MIERLVNGMWERVKARHPQLAAADRTDDQTHTHHALVTVLTFGTLGAIALGWRVGIDEGLRYGIVAGWVFYAVREVVNRISTRGLRLRFAADYKRLRFAANYKPWDGVGDVLVPLWVTAPVVVGSVKVLWALSWLFAIYYFLLRPVRSERPDGA